MQRTNAWAYSNLQLGKVYAWRERPLGCEIMSSKAVPPILQSYAASPARLDLQLQHERIMACCEVLIAF